ncbi:hypothetical protein [Antrihabitans cavernicola]|uniref:Uncharacterized protein n=1 Tax=Antrihabitans cavernicola TaxID=2495913 RepID=A0A5A7SID0_9NOCA|nr:hypothetical protein [Spelaeibacter cavernicola]KAA0024487.1 hypothetical protein FOY51_00510 [Spelaeibacter cavernicola]
MIWPVVVDDEPFPDDLTWHVGDTVSAQLSWTQEPTAWGQDDVEPLLVSGLFAVDYRSAEQAVVRAGRLAAVWQDPADLAAGRHRLAGVLTHDRYLALTTSPVVTRATVASIDAVRTQYFLDGGHWVAIAGTTDTVTVPSCDTTYLVDETLSAADDLSDGHWVAGTSADNQVLDGDAFDQRFPTRNKPRTARRARWFRVQLEVGE